MRVHSASWKALIAGVAFMAAHMSAHAVDSFSVEAAAGDKVQMARVGVQWDWGKRWLSSNGSHLGGYWDLTVAQWRGSRYQDLSGQHQNLTNVGFTPVFRWQQDSKKGLYLEAGIGLNFLSKHYDNNGRRFSTRFQFGDHLGIGYVFDNKLDIGLKVQHFSNASIKKPNPGENFIALRVSYPL